jgi:hypothetical protein
MPDEETTIPEAKRTGREDEKARNLPAEFADDLRFNRFTPPPDPPTESDDDELS